MTSDPQRRMWLFSLLLCTECKNTTTNINKMVNVISINSIGSHNISYTYSTFSIKLIRVNTSSKTASCCVSCVPDMLHVCVSVVSLICNTCVCVCVCCVPDVIRVFPRPCSCPCSAVRSWVRLCTRAPWSWRCCSRRWPAPTSRNRFGLTGCLLPGTSVSSVMLSFIRSTYY